MQGLRFGIISHKDLAWSEHDAEVIEIGPDGFSIEMREMVEPGYLWFLQQVGGNRGGFLEWCRPDGNRYLARVRYVPLSWNVESYVSERARRSLAHQPLRDPKEIIGHHLMPSDPEATH